MKQRFLCVFIWLVTCLAGAHGELLEGYSYDNHPSAPSGLEWQQPEALSLNKLQPRAWCFSFGSERSAQGVLPERGAYWESLDGLWRFHWCRKPEDRPMRFFEPSFDASSWDEIAVPGCWNVQGIQPDGSLKWGVPIYVNQKVIFEHRVAVDDWRGGVMREPRNADWTTREYRNEVGSYRRTFTLPSAWKTRRVIINFDGVDSFFYLWINGHYVGFSKNSRNTASFDITRFVDWKREEQVVALEVYRNSDGSFLEAQDMFRLPGIIRSTYLTSVPQVGLSDLIVRTTRLTGDGRGNGDAELELEAEIRSFDKKLPRGLSVEYKAWPLRLYNDYINGDVALFESVQLDAQKAEDGLTVTKCKAAIPEARTWSAEEPNRYVLTATLKDKHGKVLDVRSTYFGVRLVEIKFTLGGEDEFSLDGRYFYVNHQPVKLKGVNRHETNPWRGHAITREQMEQEVFLMKRGNINHVRNSHYSNDPYWYYLCDKYGIYLEDEANIESHEYYYGDASLSHPAEWKAAHVARNMELVRAHVNAPSIVIWSLGNEAGPGKNFVAAYEAIKQFDTSRPVQYERNNDIVDMGSNQYPSVPWVENVAKGKASVKYPFHISEYAHSMGNAGGGLADFWKAIESSNFFCGGAIWDWVDQAIWSPKPSREGGKGSFLYGGDFGDQPNDGMFCMNGVMLPDLSPKPLYWEVKHVYQNIGVALTDTVKGEIEVFNKHYFISLKNTWPRYRLLRDGVEVGKGRLLGFRNSHGPRERKTYRLPYEYSQLDPGSTWTAIVEFTQNEDVPWAEKGYVQMSEEVIIREAAQTSGTTLLPITQLQPVKSTKAQQAKAAQALKQIASGPTVTVEGNGFKVVFDNQTGGIQQFTAGSRQLIGTGEGPRLDALRAPVDNDNWFYQTWYQNGLHNLRHVATLTAYEKLTDGRTVIGYSVTSQGERRGQIQGGSSGRYAIKDGDPMTEEDFHFQTNLVYTVHPDGVVQLEAYIAPSSRLITLPRLGYLFQLPRTLNHLTYFGRGPQNNYNDRCSGAFLGQYTGSVMDQFVAFPKPQEMANREDVRWLSLTDASGMGLLFASTHSPLSTSALPWSDLELTFAPHPAELPRPSATWLHLDVKDTGLGGTSCGQAPPYRSQRVLTHDYDMGFLIVPLREAGDAQKVKAKRAGFQPSAVERKPDGSVKVSVLAASSEEPGENADHLVDGDPGSIWHTAYGVTVTKYPHTVDFDCGELKTIQGFTYMPRQDGGHNGDIKDYQILLSSDGKTWSAPVAEGRFEPTSSVKRVTFQKPTRARYLRFVALSSQNGLDFASGAEFTVLAE